MICTNSQFFLSRQIKNSAGENFELGFTKVCNHLKQLKTTYNHSQLPTTPKNHP